MKFFISLLVLVSVVAADGTLQKPEITSPPAMELEPRDFIDEISSFTSAIAAAPSYIESVESSRMSEFSSQFANLTASASAATSSLGLQLSTAADAAASTSIQSQLSQVAANVSSASAALQAAASAVSNSTSTSSSATSSSTKNVGCAPTAALGVGVLAGGFAILAQM